MKAAEARATAEVNERVFEQRHFSDPKPPRAIRPNTEALGPAALYAGIFRRAGLLPAQTKEASRAAGNLGPF